jgi:hypothetical protein
MQVRLRDPITRFEKIQQQLTQLLIGDPRLRVTFAGFGISEDFRERKNRIVALCQSPIDPERFRRLLNATEEVKSDQFDVPEFVLIETGEIRAASRPVAGGDGIQLRSGPSGTLGCLVVDGHHDELFLSCNHVIADCNTAAISAPIDEPSYSGNLLGYLHDFEPLQFGSTSVNIMDAAVGKPDVMGDVGPGLRTGSAFLHPPDLAPVFNSKVEKEGASTGHTTGVLTLKNLSVLVNFPGGSALFDKQYAVIGAPNGFWGSLAQPHFATGGDSGSVVVLNSRVIGLLFAVSSRVDMAFVTPIDSILKRFGVRIV